MKQIDIATEFAYPIRHGVAACRRQAGDCTIALTVGSYRISKHGKLWELRDAAGELVCLTAYKKGAIEVVRRLSAIPSPSDIVAP
jgi:hypothetical protein